MGWKSTNKGITSGSGINSINKEVEDARDQIAAADFVIAQFETPQEATLRAFQIAKENGVKTILNPAPAHEINPDLLKLALIGMKEHQ